VTFSSNFFEMNRRCNYQFQVTAGRVITLRAALRSGPFWVDRRLTFESSDRSVTWPFEDVERGRRIDLKAEFPEAFR
jgi:hypothetical protein